MRNIWPYPPTASRSYGREAGKRAGWQTGRQNTGGFRNLKLFYRLNYSDFYFVQYHCNFTAVLELHSVDFRQIKVYFKVCFEVQKSGSHFLCQSLLLGSNVPNDKNNTCTAILLAIVP